VGELAAGATPVLYPAPFFSAVVASLSGKVHHNSSPLSEIPD